MENLRRSTSVAPMLLTDTTPAEVPIIFSNRGFFNKVVGPSTFRDTQMGVKIIDLVFRRSQGLPRETLPFKYSIHKGSGGLRTLSLLHPANQLSLLDFYKRYASLILFYCGRSSFSLRAPIKPGRPKRFSSRWRRLGAFTNSSVDNSQTPEDLVYLGHFFDYRGYSRIYQFFSSSQFAHLEKQFDELVLLDVSKCFDSIYTHSIAWAVRSVPVMKERVNRNAGSFGQRFDLFMRQGNSGETNGIVIGPETSRIFAEIILQKIDSDTEEAIKERSGLTVGVDYEVRRYVDDIFLFATSKDAASRVMRCYEESLSQFRMSFNEQKAEALSRPFVTTKSRIIRDVETQVERFLKGFLSESKRERDLKPRRIARMNRMVGEFVARVKNVCSYNSVGYQEVSGYVIGILASRVKTAISAKGFRPDSDDGKSQAARAASAILKAMFYFYSVAPTVSSSYRLSSSCIFFKRYASDQLGAYAPLVHQSITEEVREFLLSADNLHLKNVGEFAISLECLNLMLVLADFGDTELISEDILKPHLITKKELSYFEIICFLFIIGGDVRFDEQRKVLVEAIELKLNKDPVTNWQDDAECVHLFFDVLPCPHIPLGLKKRCIRSFFRSCGESKPSEGDLDYFLESAKNEVWFVDWKQKDILRMLKEKEQRTSY